MIDQILNAWPIIVAAVGVSWLVIRLWVEIFTMKKFVSKTDYETLINNFNAHQIVFNSHQSETKNKLTEMSGQFKLIEERLLHNGEQSKMQAGTIIEKVEHLTSNLEQAENGERKLMMEALLKFIEKEK